MSGCNWSRGATRMPATEASEAPMDQLSVESCHGAPAEQPDERPVVDDAAHGDAGAGPVEEEAQPDGDGDGGPDGDDVLLVDADAEEREAVEAEELGDLARRGLPDVVVDEPEQQQREPDGHGQRGRHVVRVHPLDHRRVR